MTKIGVQTKKVVQHDFWKFKWKQTKSVNLKVEFKLNSLENMSKWSGVKKFSKKYPKFETFENRKQREEEICCL